MIVMGEKDTFFVKLLSWDKYSWEESSAVGL